MGTVYLAVSHGPSGFHKLKVVKRLRDELSEDPAFVAMFMDEASLAARLYHPNIVQTNDVGFDGEHFFIEMEYLEGQPLDALRRAGDRADPLPLPLSLWILSQVLTGLHYAHELRDLDGTPLHVVHRDVSPHNVFLTYEGNVKLLDFGIAKAAVSSAETRTGVVKGKITYMAPEQAAPRDDRPIDRRADVFAVGVMLWQAITGRRLWDGLSDAEIDARLRSGEIPSAAGVATDAPPALLAICARALAPRPEERFATADELRAAIDEHLAGAGGAVGPRALAEFLAARFARQRADAQAQIDARMKSAAAAGAGADAEVDVPRLRSSPGHTPRKTPGSADVGTANTLGKRGDPGAPRPSAPAPRPARAGAWAIAACAGAALVFAAIIARQRRGATPTAAAIGAQRASAAACARNADCAGDGNAADAAAASLCRDGRCVPLATAECTVHAEPGDVARDDTVWIGAMFPLTGDAGRAYGMTAARTVDLARRDFASIAGGIPGASAKTPRALGLVTCDDTGDAARVARHLVDDLRVPAVIGFYSSKEVIELARSTFIPAGVLAVASLNTSALITAIPHPEGSPRLVFRTAVGTTPAVFAVSMLVSTVIEPELTAARVVGRGSPMRVALVRRGTSAGLGFSDALISTLRFNGASVIENGAAFQQFSYGDPLGLEGPVSYDEAVAGILKFRPHVIVQFGADEVVRPVLAPIEARWPRTEAFRPRYVSASNLEGRDLLAFVGHDEALRRRFLGIAPPATTPANARLTLRYNEVYPDKVSTANTQAAPYDSFYLVAYAAAVAGAGGKPLTGVDLARAIARLQPPGRPIDVGPTRIFDAFNELAAGANIDLTGAMTTLDFDLRTGDAAADLAVVCFGKDAAGAAADSVESGLTFRARTRALEGTLRCP